jgi:tetratricopeptide (TPR) repeat protein
MAKDDTSFGDSFDPDLDELERLSNEVLDRIERRLFDEAERKCFDLKLRFPDTIDWIDRSAELHEARGNVDKAVEHYRRCLDYIDRHPDGFDAESRGWYRQKIGRLLHTRG